MGQGALKLAQYSLFVINVFVGLIGLHTIVSGILPYNNISDNDYINTIRNFILIGLGSVALVMAFLGYWGAAVFNYCMLVIYAVLVSLIIVFELGVGITVYGFTHSPVAHHFLLDILRGTLNDYEYPVEGPGPALEPAPRSTASTFWDNVQSGLNCCGAKNYTDWYRFKDSPPEFNLAPVPNSCCRLATHPFGTNNCGGRFDDNTPTGIVKYYIYTDGCADTLVRSVSLADCLTSCMTLCITLGVLEFLAVLLASFLAKHARRGTYYYQSL